MNQKKVRDPVLLLTILVAILIYLKNAWISDDAYILFRSLEQLVSGNGPIWNPHERVQVYSSPLWYLILIFPRLFAEDYYLTTVLLSLILWILVIVVLRQVFQHKFHFLLAILLFLSSNAFHDYASSGLENVLAYLLISLYVLIFGSLFTEVLKQENHSLLEKRRKRIFFLLGLFGLLILVRHDLALLFLPATLYVVVRFWRDFTFKRWVGMAVLAALPFGLFTIFSILYYGFPLPNPAYAKLFAGIEKLDIIRQGSKYYLASLKFDLLTLVIIFGSALISFFAPSKKHLRFLTLGVVLNLLYILSIGGDFMQGRFFSYAYLVSTLVLLLRMPASFQSRKLQTIPFALLCAYLILYPHTPVNSPLDYENKSFFHGIADERGYYFSGVSLKSYFSWERGGVDPFPNFKTVISIIDRRSRGEKYAIRENIGFVGLHAGTEMIIIDPISLADPFLARLPAGEDCRIGHFFRDLPDGYVASVTSGENQIADPDLSKFYDKIRIVTQGEDLFSAERLRTIFELNTGKYNYLLPES